MRHGGTWWVGALGGALIVGALGAEASRRLRVEEVTPPPRRVETAAPATVLPDPKFEWLSEAARPRERPRMPLPGGTAAINEMLGQIREACELLKEQRMTALQFAEHFGAVLRRRHPPLPGDPPEFSIDIRPHSLYFQRGFVAYGRSAIDKPTKMPAYVVLYLTKPRHLPFSAMVKAFGKPYETLGDGGSTAPGLGFPWKKQPKGPRRCMVSADQDWGHNHGMKESVITSVMVDWGERSDF